MALFARDLMQRDVGVVDARVSLADLERALADAGVSGLPVVDAGRVVGVVSRADVLRELGGRRGPKPQPPTFYADLNAFEVEAVFDAAAEASARSAARLEDLRAEDLMTRTIFAVESTTPLADVARVLAENRIHRVLVIDDGMLVGIVSALDVVRLVGEGKLRAG